MKRLFSLLGCDRGDSSVISMLLWFPVIVFLLFLIDGAGRFNTVASITQDAAESAAREARRAETPDEGITRAELSLNQSLANYNGECSSTVDVSNWNGGSVSVEVTCSTKLEGVAHTNLTDRTVTRSWTESIDNARILRAVPEDS